jgi:group I intron endonuclease
VNRLNGRCYVGQTTNLQMRIREHIQEGMVSFSDHPLYGDMVRYGLATFMFTILDSAISKDELSRKEVAWSRHFNAGLNQGGYCKKVGGRTGYLSAEMKEKIGLAFRGKPKSLEHAKKAADGRRGKTTSLKGRSKTPEHIENAIAPQRGKARSNRGTSHSLEHARKAAEGKRLARLRREQMKLVG